jgi:predicted DNA-binding protein (MmcQ/YjbR family)
MSALSLQQLRRHLLALPGAVEDFPFGPEHLVGKVGGKMFALIALAEVPLRMNLKCQPEHAEVLRSYYPAVLPGYHMNKRHWNTLVLDGTIPEDEILSMVDDSYHLVVNSLPKQLRSSLPEE